MAPCVQVLELCHWYEGLQGFKSFTMINASRCFKRVPTNMTPTSIFFSVVYLNPLPSFTLKSYPYCLFAWSTIAYCVVLKH
jgi:hypothetical protein